MPAVFIARLNNDHMKTKVQNLLITLALLAGIHQAAAQGTTAFTYQGQLHDNGTNANGIYAMIFKLYDSSSGGTQIGTGITNNPTLANGLFTVNLDFGNVFTNGNARWLDITVTNSGATQTLSPRVQVLPTPYAQFAAIAAVAATAPNGVSLGGTNYIPNIQVFGSSGTFIVPAGVTKIQVVMWGGGGGGGGAYIHSAATNSLNLPGGGGGAGCYAVNVFSVTNGTSYAVTIGSGGNGGNNGQNGTAGSASSFGNLMTAGGGGGGQAASSLYPGSGGSGASCTGAIANFHSKSGQAGFYSLGSGTGGDGGTGASAWAGGSGGWGNGNNGDSDGEGPGAAGGGAGAAAESSAGNGSGGAVFVYY